ncbi:undecaprenyl-phosphate glucose phosphotransferase [bacterium]|nr:undecaprenyl-phosphate glucose phosphotransferase [bacterium]
MLKKQAQVIITILFLLDLTIIGTCWNIAYFVRFYWANVSYSLFGFDIPYAAVIPEFSEYFKATFVIMFFAAFCFTYAKMYNPKRISRYKAEFRSILKANIFLFVILTGTTFYYREFSYSRVQSLYFLLFSVISLTIFRAIVRSILSYLRSKGKNLRRVLIIGNRLTALKFLKKVFENRQIGYVVVGYVGIEENRQMMTDYLGTYDKITQIIEKQEVDQVFIALDANQQSDLQIINSQLAEQMVDLNIVPDIYHTLNINPEILDLDGMPIIALRQSSVEGWNRILKRSFDLFGALVAIILLLPFWIIIPILIKIFSPGPIFYMQERMGLDGRSFNMLKFRSMHVDAERQTGAVWAKKNDDRRTPLGAFLRETSLDEIPQFFNVLSGSMSLVGPRPERPVFIKEFRKSIPNYMLRHKMKAGITGWAQVNGWRGNTSLEKRIECDIYYLTHWSIGFDIRIIIKTFFTGIKNPNAY